MRWKHSRKRTKLEIYSDLYYKERFYKEVQKEIRETKPQGPETLKEAAARKLAIYQKHRACAWDSETDDIKAIVKKVYNQGAEDSESSKGNDGATDGATDGDKNDPTEIEVLELQQE